MSPAHAPRTGTGKLLARFLRLLLPVFLIASSIGLYVLGTFTFGDERNQLATRIGNLAARTASTINRMPNDMTRAQRDAILSPLLADSAVSCALLIGGDGGVRAAAPQGIGCKGAESAAVIEVPVSQVQGGGKLCVKYNLAELAERSGLFRTFTQLALLGSLLVAGLASWFSFRTTVGRHVLSLLNAIQKTRQLGTPARVENVPDDELGAVIAAFNDMQSDLESEANRRASVLRRLDYIYNDTPALMFSIDRGGNIRTVSGHWLEETGWQRSDVTGAPLEKFLCCPSGTNMTAITQMILAADRPLRDIPLSLLRQDGSQMDVLLASVPDIDDAETAKLCVLSDISGLRAAQNELRQQAITDHLTGLPNRQALFEHLSAFKNNERDDLLTKALLFIDLDNFKTVNDTLGHDAGDQLLRAATRRIRNCIASRDFLARLGGDEFAIVLHGLRTLEDANVIANRIIAAMAVPFRLGEATAEVGASIGIAGFADCGSGDDVLRLADLAMYQSKQSGKNCVSRYSSDLTAKVVARDLMVRKIRDALANDHLRFHLQPIIDMNSMQVKGAEALLRLDCPNDGLISPVEIIKVAEETGLIGQISTWSVAEAIRLSEKHMQALGGLGRYLSVNLSPRQITRAFIEELVARLLASPGIAKSLVFEITETALFGQDVEVSELLHRLRGTGARIALDDFGTGYSSLGHVHRFPVDIIKLDRSFVKALAGDDGDARRCRALIRATAALASELDMTIIAEGIEDQATMDRLRGFGVPLGQGYLFAPPLPVDSFRQWLDAFGRTKAEAPNVVKFAI